MSRRWCPICAVAVAYVALWCVGQRSTVVVERFEAPANDDVVEPSGGLTGRVVFAGEIPERRVVVKAGNPGVDGFCCSYDILSDELIVNPDDRGVMHAFVYLRSRIPPEEFPPGLREPVDAAVEVEVEGCQFRPHTSIIRTGQAIEVTSSDATPHAVQPLPLFNSSQGGAIPFDFNSADPKPVGSLTIEAYTSRERVPFEVQCMHHAWMSAYWLVLDHPYAAVTDSHGRFTITGLPVGEHDFIVWHELAGFIRKKLSVTIRDAETTELKDITVAAGRFR